MSILKYSRQRESIKENLMHRKDHPTADMVYSDIRKIYPRISLGTVYRNLALLSDMGEIQKITANDGAVRFDGNPAPHVHFICRKCTSVLDFEQSDIAQIQALASKQFDGIVESCHVNLYGVCSKCCTSSSH